MLTVAIVLLLQLVSGTKAAAYRRGFREFMQRVRVGFGHDFHAMFLLQIELELVGDLVDLIAVHGDNVVALLVDPVRRHHHRRKLHGDHHLKLNKEREVFDEIVAAVVKHNRHHHQVRVVRRVLHAQAAKNECHLLANVKVVVERGRLDVDCEQQQKRNRVVPAGVQLLQIDVGVDVGVGVRVWKHIVREHKNGGEEYRQRHTHPHGAREIAPRPFVFGVKRFVGHIFFVVDDGFPLGADHHVIEHNVVAEKPKLPHKAVQKEGGEIRVDGAYNVVLPRAVAKQPNARHRSEHTKHEFADEQDRLNGGDVVVAKQVHDVRFPLMIAVQVIDDERAIYQQP
mmetsp:Transcript_37834/g.62211  ORF Transcript_37834/g.62211 Transcript_37834/m.62211 type:complete len:340 (-) Transcript_37834:79-1098(-)